MEIAIGSKVSMKVEGKISLLSIRCEETWRIAASIVLRANGDAHLFGHDYRLMVPAVRVEDDCSRNKLRIKENPSRFDETRLI